LLPPAFALLLTLAAGLSMAEEHAWHQADGPNPAPALRPDAVRPAKAAHTSGTGHRGQEAMHTPQPITAVGHNAAPGIGLGSGVGSRALTGEEAHDDAPSERPDTVPATSH
jgi:hypothetical protein